LAGSRSFWGGIYLEFAAAIVAFCTRIRVSGQGAKEGSVG
jgi:hypothetical protein